MDFLDSSAHPDPGWARRWVSLDGEWEIARGGKNERINVPFPIGSKASGVDFKPWGRFVYSRKFRLDSLSWKPGERGERGERGKPWERREGQVWIRVGACDHETVVRINGAEAGRHVGGYCGFGFEISRFLRPGENDLALEVKDSLRLGQVRGKQSFLPFPFAVWYPGYAGLWQSVWLEFSGACRLEPHRVEVSWDEGLVRFSLDVRAMKACDLAGLPDDALGAEIITPGGERLRLPFSRAAVKPAPGPPPEPGESAAGEGEIHRASFSAQVRLADLGPFLWSCETPHLYRISYRLKGKDGGIEDEAEAYFGLRRIESRDGALWLNGKPLALRMALVQGYYPQGGYRPAAEDAMERDIIALKGMGFNGARIHQKIESPRFLALCDRLGLLATGEMPSFYRSSRKVFAQYEAELKELITRDRERPCLFAWVLFNETWGIWGVYRAGSPTRRFVKRMVGLARQLDPSRLVIDNSGWEHLDTDIADLHHYLGTARRAVEWYDSLARGEDRAMRGVSFLKTLGFYLGSGISRYTKALFLDKEAEDRALDSKVPWMLSEYGGFGWYQVSEEGTVEERIERYTLDAAASGLFAGYCLTQLYDVGSETNGLLDFLRNPKVDAKRIEAVNRSAGSIIQRRHGEGDSGQMGHGPVLP